MNDTATIHEPAIRPVALDRLSVAPENVRKTPPDAAAEAELKASIAGHGLIENLVVRSDGPSGGSYAVVAGGRRLAALKALAADGVLDAAHPVPCLVVKGDAASSELSLAENVIRIAMHPADQVAAFTKLAKSGVTVAAIAARFGISARLVEQRLRLGNAAPELLDAYRADKIDLETLKAFTVTTDHRRQMAVWEQVANQSYRPAPWEVKRLLTEKRIPANSAMARFVGIDPYEAAGGPVLRDLFAAEDDSGIWLEDPALLQKLTMEKLGDTVKDLQTRWRWATAMPEVDWTSLARYGRIQPEPAEPTEEETAEFDRLRTREDELADLDEDEWTEALAEEAGAIETRMGEISAAIEARETYRAEDYAIAGAIATIAWNGELRVIGGLVRPEDMPKPADSGNTDGNAVDGHDDDATEPVRLQGTAISAPIASPPDPRAEARKQAGVGIGLADDLRSIRTALVKAHLGNDFEAAFDLMLFQLGRAVFTRGDQAEALDIAITETADRPTMRMNDRDFGAWSPGEAMLADRSGLPLDWLTIEDDGESFAALRALPEAQKQTLFAASVARTLKGQLAFEPQARPELEATVARLDIDFAGHVRPTADMLWSRINKGRILDIARETLGPAWVSARAKSKKAALAKAMEEAFAAGSPPLGITADAHAAALAWTPPGLKAFDAGNAGVEDAGAETAAPAEAADSAADPEPSPGPQGAGAEQVEPGSAGAPADPPQPVSAAESIEAPGAAAATNGNGNGDDAPAGDETDPTACDDVRTAEADGADVEPAGTPAPPEIASHAGKVNGYDHGDIPEFLRRV
ncbi:MAG: ParB N-terminal domain-containing protein [Defluviicoccus sp.]|nr:ParB N-terminal domain-containing protein [Defluviicoccus sp.]